MSKPSIGPSELHLKKELTALQKARYLRDPETSSSWRSPLSSRSFVANSNLTNAVLEKNTGEINHGSSLKLHSKCRNGKDKAYQKSWRNYSTRSGQRVSKLDDENREGSVKGNIEKNISLSNSIVDSKSDTCLEVQGNMYSVADTDSGTPIRGTTRKIKRRLISKRGAIKHSAITKLMDSASSSLGILDSGEQSDASEDYNSEDLQHWDHELTHKTGCISCSASPFLHGFRYGSRLYFSKFPRTSKRVGSSHSCTPASTSSYYKYGGQEPSNVGSWDETATSFDGDELDQLELQKAQRCGITCYRSKRFMARRIGGFNSPSLSDTLKRKGSSILCGSQSLYPKKSSGCHKQNYLVKSSQGLPLLTNSCNVGHSSLDSTSDDLSSKLGELDLEALSRLDGRRWSSCKSQDGLEADLPGGNVLEIAEQRTLSQKYQPKSFCDIIGQHIVTQSLSNAISRGRIATAYLFHGPRGTGKTSTARIFAAALNCLSSEVNRPCWSCRECSNIYNRNGTNLNELNATNKMSIDQVNYLLNSLSLAKTSSQYKVFVIDECHMLSSKNWTMFMKFFEEPLPRVVLIFITIEVGNLPRVIISRCQKYLFSKVKDADIVCRLRKLSIKENLDIELDALDLIALNSNGSLRDAETMLDQLSLLGKRITTSLVNDLVGVVPEEKLLYLLEVAMSSDTAETVKRSRELIDSGVDPIALMSQLAGLIMDIIAGTYRLANSDNDGAAICGRSLTEAELERLQLALKILSDAEKQLRHSSERSTWFTAALLQLGSGHNFEPNRSSNSSRPSVRRISNVMPDQDKLHTVCENRASLDRTLADSGQTNDTRKEVFRSTSPEKLEEIWRQCIDRCQSNTLRQLLYANGKLLSINRNEGILIAVIGFVDPIIKSRAERFLSSITNSMEIVLGQNVDLRICVIPNFPAEGLPSMPSFMCSQVEKGYQRANKERVMMNNVLESCNKNLLSSQSYENCVKSAPEHMNHMQKRMFLSLSERKYGNGNKKEKDNEIATQRHLKAVTGEQRLETAWLQTAELGCLSRQKPEKKQVLPRNGFNNQQNAYSTEIMTSSKHWDDEMDEIKNLSVSITEGHNKEHIEGLNHYAISPSSLHCSNKIINIEKETMGYESGPNCNGLLCWKAPKKQVKVKQGGIHLRSPNVSRLSIFGQCGKLKATESGSNK